MAKLWIKYTILAYSYFKIMLGTVLGCTGKIFPDLAGHPATHRREKGTEDQMRYRRQAKASRILYQKEEY